MMKNVGTADRVIRIILGLAILCLAFVLQGDQRYFALIGIIPLLTGLFGFCPLYALFHISTRKQADKK